MDGKVGITRNLAQGCDFIDAVYGTRFGRLCIDSAEGRT